ncbi:hypothetical protein FRC08_001797 [Ceratobasidium sp. 394]|nr:hypothetical protein FRC08_001797 [Ceratobasidium sp. 394]KAG9093732.1 hypothetical protein FS749_013853 [Ceratobasidium sp. UAMH 11750]
MRDSISTASPDTADPLDSPLGITHFRELRQPPPYRPDSPLSVELPGYSQDNVDDDPQIPFVWPSVAKHHPAVNLNITRLLFAVQSLCDKLDLWESSGSTRQEVKDAFARMSREWIRVQDSLVECCAADMRDVEQGMNKTQQIIAHIINQGHSRGALKEALPMFQDTVREEVVNGLRAKIHPRSY